MKKLLGISAFLLLGAFLLPNVSHATGSCSDNIQGLGLYLIQPGTSPFTFSVVDPTGLTAGANALVCIVDAPPGTPGTGINFGSFGSFFNIPNQGVHPGNYEILWSTSPIGSTGTNNGITFYTLDQNLNISQSLSVSSTSQSFLANYAASTTLASIGAQCSTGNIFSDGLCVALSYLFLPDPSTLAQFAFLASTTEGKFPVISQVSTEFNSLSASTTNNYTAIDLNLHSLGIGSTSPIGNILPDMDVLSSTSVTQLNIPSGSLDGVKTLAGYAIWLAFVSDVFFTTRNLFATL